NRAVLRVLGINTGDQDITDEEELVFHLQCHLTLHELKFQRFKEHVVSKRRLHIFTVQIGKQAVADADHMAEILHMFKAETLLLSRAKGSVISHQRCKYSQSQPAEKKFSGRISVESSQIRSCIQETAHIQGRKHLQVQKDVGPP